MVTCLSFMKKINNLASEFERMKKLTKAVKDIRKYYIILPVVHESKLLLHVIWISRSVARCLL